MPSPLILILAVCLLAGCATPVPPGAAATKPVWLIGNGFHTALIFRARDTPPAWRQLHGDERADFLLIGWGHRTFYTGGQPTLATFTRAALLPSPSALHLAPIRGPIAHAFPQSDLVRLQITPPGFDALRHDVDAAFTRDSYGQPIPLQPGHLSRSRFYLGADTFIFPYTCNLWCARALRKAGVPLFPPSALTADNLVCQARRSGKMEQRKSRPVNRF